MRDSKDSGFGAVDLFIFSRGENIKVEVHRGAVSKDVRPDRSETIRFGYFFADIMSPVPEKTDLSTFIKVFIGHSLSHTRKFNYLRSMVPVHLMPKKRTA